ncbi:cytochrome c oxidase subunit II (mitochondrion) [Culicoides brevitarsis]|uniref:cytochrome c oxidase subunit II n=1 Tax=Culicoides brevitarsis TaxID=469753 RepID=UPI002E779FA8|nr:cytochrome c oxidase subunit II [Culicoides brevitarsis]WPN85959.1 cytochrome c oxidase subunit II [Culicoides brevitarsis]
MATWGSMFLLDSSSPVMEQLNFFHDHTLLVLMIITVLIGNSMLSLFFNKFSNRFLLMDQFIEIFWTIMPVLVLFAVALPSMRLLYLLDDPYKSSISVKVIGHQWYWSYEYPDFNNLEFDSYMIPTNELNMNEFRLLDVDNRLILPSYTNIRFIVSAMDVLHSWTIPSLGIKVDAVPGRLNQINTYMYRVGLYFGQCSEICGANHSFMPIVLESVSIKYFIAWMKNFMN